MAKDLLERREVVGPHDEVAGEGVAQVVKPEAKDPGLF